MAKEWSARINKRHTLGQFRLYSVNGKVSGEKCAASGWAGVSQALLGVRLTQMGTIKRAACHYMSVNVVFGVFSVMTETNEEGNDCKFLSQAAPDLSAAIRV